MRNQWYAILSDLGYWSGIGWTKDVGAMQWHAGHCEAVEKRVKLNEDFEEIRPRVIQKYKKNYWV